MDRGSKIVNSLSYVR